MIEERGAGDLSERFCAAWEALGGEAALAESAAAAVAEVARRLQEAGAKKIVYWQDERLEAAGLERALGALPLEARPWDGAGGIAFAAAADAGITWADAAVAATGTLMVAADIGAGRSVGLLPPWHICFVRAEDVRLSRSEAWRALLARRGGRMPSALHMVSGPSRTADIEMDLAVGVHGPGRALAVVLRSGA